MSRQTRYTGLIMCKTSIPRNVDILLAYYKEATNQMQTKLKRHCLGLRRILTDVFLTQKYENFS